VALSRPVRTRRKPEETVLYRVLAEHLETFLERTDGERSGLPWFVRKELRGFLDCGILCRGLARVHCSACGKDDVVAFSCKGRGFCPSCGARRMHDTAAWLVDRVLPWTPVRQWVLALPHRVRFLCAYDPELCRGVRTIFVRAVASFYKARAKRSGVAEPRTGCVASTQRFDSALRTNLHFHTLWPDGTFTCSPGAPEVAFHPAAPPTDEEIARLARTLRSRVLRFLHKRGALPREDGDEPSQLDDPPVLAALAAASVQGKRAFGPRAGRHADRIGRGTECGGEFRRGKLCADADGFSLHAGVLIPDYCREKLERLCAYAVRPPVVHERMSLSEDGTRVVYKLKKKYRDGSTHVVLEPLDLIARLAALVPRPRVNLVTYHGVLAPAASCRDRVVPSPPPAREATPPTCKRSTKSTESKPSPTPHASPRRYSWAELMQRVYAIDVLTCQHCGGRRSVLAFHTDPRVIGRILDHLGLPTDPPCIASARAPPEPTLPYA